jgi:hypothetical protein
MGTRIPLEQVRVVPDLYQDLD